MISTSKIVILTPQSGLYLAKWLQYHLVTLNYRVQIVPNLGIWRFFARGFVIAPQCFRFLPKTLIPVQVEQLVSSRGFDHKLHSKLRSSPKIFEFSQSNVQLLKQRFGSPVIELIQPEPMNLIDRDYCDFGKRDIDVLFYGWTASERRKSALKQLAQDCSIHIAEDVYGSELYALISRSRLVVNIHFYEDAILETIRLSEVLSHGTPVLSETSLDAHGYAFAGLVDFFPIGNWEQLTNIARLLVSDSSTWQRRHQIICNAISAQTPNIKVTEKLSRAIATT